MQTAYFERFEIEISIDDAHAISHPGPCDTDVAALVSTPEMTKQLDEIGPEKIREELREYGAWDEDDLTSDDDNRQCIVWIAGGNIIDETRES